MKSEFPSKDIANPTMRRQYKPAEIFDLDDMVKNWAVDVEKILKRPKKTAKIPPEHTQYNIDWELVQFVHKEPEYLLTPKKSKILFKTVYNNNTDQDQQHTFKTEGSSRTTCDISLERCFTANKEVNLNLKMPLEVLEAKAGFKPELAISDVHGLCIDESLTWGVDSIIKVPAGYQTTAELEVFESELMGKFSFITELTGHVFVNLINKKDNKYFRALQGDISNIITHGSLKGFSKVNGDVSFVTEGYCHFRFTERHVNVHQSRI